MGSNSGSIAFARLQHKPARIVLVGVAQNQIQIQTNMIPQKKHSQGIQIQPCIYDGVSLRPLWNLSDCYSNLLHQ